MPRPLPPLNALRAFEATARHLSFAKAAGELHVTPAALSHQVRGLEDRLGLQLFHRRTRAIELTEAARLIYPGIHAAFETMREAIQRLDRLGQDNVLVVSATRLHRQMARARLYRFMELYPEIDIRISASMQPANFETDGIDVAVRFVLGLFPISTPRNSWTTRCFRSAAHACSTVPSPYGRQGSGAAYADPCRHAGASFRPRRPGPIGSGSWESKGWMRHAACGSTQRTTRSMRPPRAGIALGYKVIALGDLQAGRLVVPFGPELPLRARGYHFVCPRRRAAQPKVRVFRDWLFAEMAQAVADLGDFGARRRNPVERE